MIIVNTKMFNLILKSNGAQNDITVHCKCEQRFDGLFATSLFMLYKNKLLRHCHHYLIIVLFNDHDSNICMYLCTLLDYDIFSVAP